MSAAVGRLGLVRESGCLADQAIAYRIHLDDAHVDGMRGGETREIAVGPGWHRLTLRHTRLPITRAWSKEVTFDVGSSHRVEGACGFNWTPLTAFVDFLRPRSEPMIYLSEADDG